MVESVEKIRVSDLLSKLNAKLRDIEKMTLAIEIKLRHAKGKEETALAKKKANLLAIRDRIEAKIKLLEVRRRM